MAELGSIQYEDSRQRTSVRDQNDQRDVLEGIRNVGEAAIEAKTQDILGEFREELDETTREAVDQTEQPLVAPKTPSTGDPEADAAIARIATLQAQVNASSGNTQRRVEMELRKKTEELRRKFPGLQKNIDAEFSTFKSTDADFAQLALSDAANTSFSAQAAAELKLISDEAYGNGAGQLGMDPLKFRLGTPEFVQEYAYQQSILKATQDNVRLTAAIHAQRANSATELPGRWAPIMQGRSSAIQATLQNASRSFAEVSRALADPTAPGNSEKIAHWQLVGSKQAMLEVEAIEFGLALQLSEIPIELRDSVEYQAIESDVQGLLAQTGKFKEAIVTGDPALSAVYEAQTVARTMNWEASNPRLVAINTALDASKNALEFALKAELGTKAQREASNIAGTITEAASLPSVFGYAVHASGILDVPPNASSEERGHARGEFKGFNPGRNGADQTPRGYRKAANTRVNALLGPNMGAALDLGVSPRTAADHLGSIASDFDDMRSFGTPEQDLWDQQMKNLAGDNILKYQKAALQSIQPTIGEDVGEAADALWDSRENERLDGYVITLGESIGLGVPLASVMSISKDRLAKEGRVTFKIDEIKLREMISSTPSISGSVASTIGGNVREQTKAVSRAQKLANELSGRVSTHIRAKAHIQALKQGAETGDYSLAYETGGYAGFFEPKVEEEN